jgi:GNAT superfamily N-acetyltransferase
MPRCWPGATSSTTRTRARPSSRSTTRTRAPSSASCLSRGTDGLLVDDLYVREVSRRQGVGEQLLAAVADVARREGATMLRWITAEDNADAQRLYDRVARRTTWVTYEQDV